MSGQPRAVNPGEPTGNMIRDSALGLVPETLEHPGLAGLFPCGEGAGYAGGIVSAALDGMRVAEAIAAR